MAALLAGATWAGLVGWLLLRLMRQFRTHRNASLGPPPTSTEQLPAVAVIVPARNEIGNIAICLAGLTAQRGLTHKPPIIVVDDGSQGGTAAAVGHIAPARNESCNIAICLAGLTAQRGLTHKPPIIVVDDGSQDGTAEAVGKIAQDAPRTRLIEA